MASRKLSAAIAVAGIGVAVVLFLVLQDDEDADAPAPPATTTTTTEARDEEPKPEVATIVVRDGQVPVGGVQELEFAKGERIRFVVESDIAEEVHLHGYDVAKEVEAGGRVEFDVPATIEGVFELELEASGLQLAEISVTPA